MQNREEILKMMNECFRKDNVISLATIDGDTPSVRCVNAYFENGYFYIITYALSDKVEQSASHPTVAFCSADWLTGKGLAKNLGYIYNEENRELAGKLKAAFAEWFDNGHNDYEDKNTIILRIEVTECNFYYDSKPYTVDFSLF